MRSKRAWLLVLVVLIFAIGIGYFLISNSGGQQETTEVAEKPATQLSSVVMIKSDINPRTTITNDMIEVQQVPAEYIHPMALTKVEDAIGMVTLLPLNSGEQLLSTKIANPDTDYLSYKLKEGDVAFTVPVSELTAAGGMIRVGDKVNVLGSYAEDVAGKTVSKFMVYDVPVIAIGQQMGINYASDSTEGFTSMTLEVTPEDAAKLSWAQNNGTISFILKSALDKENPTEVPTIEAKTFFGDSSEFKDKEYLKGLTETIQIRDAEKKLNEFENGDVNHIRNNLDYQRFYYDQLKTDKTKTKTSGAEKSAEKEVLTPANK